MGIPVVISDNGIPVRPVDDGWPVMTVADNGLGAPITISDDGAPFVVEGYNPTPVNLVVNGDFATDLSGWVDASTAPGSVAWSSDGALMSRVTGSTGRLRQGVPTEIGKTYSLSVESVGGTVSGRLDIGTSAGGSQIEATIVVDGQISRTFVAISTTTWLNFYLINDGTFVINNVELYNIST